MLADQAGRAQTTSPSPAPGCSGTAPHWRRRDGWSSSVGMGGGYRRLKTPRRLLRGGERGWWLVAFRSRAERPAPQLV